MISRGRVTFVRHALPLVDESIPSRLWTLSQEGSFAAQQLASRLELSADELVVASAEVKARQTADALADQVLVDPRLGEVVRPWIAGSYRESAERWLNGEQLEDWETLPSAVERLNEAVSTAIEKGGGSACLVSHGLIMSAFIGLIADIDPVRMWSQLDYPDAVALDFDRREVHHYW